MITHESVHGGRPLCLRHPALRGRNSRFIKYAAWFGRVQGTLLVRTGNDVPLFPCVLPFPEVTLVEVVSDSGQARDWWGRAFVNTFVAWSNFVVLGCPRPGSSTLEPRVVYRADVQDFALKLLGEVSQFASFELVAGLLECQGKRSVLEDMLKLNFASYGGAEVGVPSGALPVSASRVAIPDTAGRVDPLEWLPPDQAAVVGDLEAIRLPEHLWEDVVVACHRVPQDEESDLAEKLLSTGMAELVKEDRLIFDRRPENSTMPR